MSNSGPIVIFLSSSTAVLNLLITWSQSGLIDIKKKIKYVSWNHTPVTSFSKAWKVKFRSFSKIWAKKLEVKLAPRGSIWACAPNWNLGGRGKYADKVGGEQICNYPYLHKSIWLKLEGYVQQNYVPRLWMPSHDKNRTREWTRKKRWMRIIWVMIIWHKYKGRLLISMEPRKLFSSSVHSGCVCLDSGCECPHSCMFAVS